MAGFSTLGERLRECRTDKHVSQEEAADAVGISRSYLGGCESGADKPGRDTLIALANYYEVRVDWLATGEGPREPTPNLHEQTLLSRYRSLSEREREIVFQVCDLLYRGRDTVQIEREPRLVKRGRR